MENSVMVARVPTALKASCAKPSPPWAAGSGIGGTAHFRAFGQRHHAKRRACLVAFADHVEVAHLKDAQRQDTARKQHRAQREQGKGAQRQGFGHGLIVLWIAVSHIIPRSPGAANFSCG
jgi:hypothetical protein